MLTRSATLRLIRLGAILMAILVIGGYAAWRSLNYARGPEIEIFEPADGASISTTTATVSGRAERVIDLHLNGSRITMDEQGYFTQTLIVFPGVNTLSFTAADQFGRNAETSLTLVGTVSLPPLAPSGI